ncbi:hypothetical protein J6590_049494 [Homalodisca vitripennis]|nr:hypothetical protein J6590_049494 [Homalodisca vitripennis]
MDIQQSANLSVTETGICGMKVIKVGNKNNKSQYACRHVGSRPEQEMTYPFVTKETTATNMTMVVELSLRGLIHFGFERKFSDYLCDRLKRIASTD